MLALRIELLTGRYCASAHNDRSGHEWPPHPARFLAACLAAWAYGDPPDDAELDVLRTIEGEAPPSLWASDFTTRSVVTHFVPVNDTRITAATQREYANLVAAEESIRSRPGDLKASKALDKARAAASTKSEKDWAPRTKDSHNVALTAAELLPELRSKQGRHFPTVIPDSSTVWMMWPSLELTKAESSALDRVLARVTRVGHSSSLVSCKIEDDAPQPTHLPDEDGDLALRVAGNGVIDRWVAAFERAPNADSRVLVTATARYRRSSGGYAPSGHGQPSTPSLGGEWFTFERVGRSRIASVRALELARAFKSALMSHAPEVTELLSGHVPRAPGASGVTEPTAQPHLAFVPLPFTGAPHADGSVIGIAAVTPRETHSDAEAALLRAIGNWEAHADGTPLVVRLPGGSRIELRRVVGRPAAATLRRGTWCRPSRHWVSVTPVALDRVPGNLHVRDPEKRAHAYRSAEETVRRSCVRAGLPEPVSVTIMHGSPLAGVAPARSFTPYRTAGGKVQRVLVHVAIAFEDDVSGPVLIGAGRFFGYGLCRPAGSPTLG